MHVCFLLGFHRAGEEADGKGKVRMSKASTATGHGDSKGTDQDGLGIWTRRRPTVHSSTCPGGRR